MADDREYGGVDDYDTKGGKIRLERKMKRLKEERVAHENFVRKFKFRKKIKEALYWLEINQIDQAIIELKEVLKGEFLL